MRDRQSSERIRNSLSVMLLMLYDLIAVIGAVLLALQLRFERIPMMYVLEHLTSLPLVLLTYLVIFYFFRLYRYRWQFAGVDTLWSVLVANFIAAAFSVFWQGHLDGVYMPRSVNILTFLLATIFVGGQRLALRLILSRRKRDPHAREQQLWGSEPKRTLILGNGHSAMDVITALTKEAAGRHDIIGILDNDPQHHGSYLRGIKILGKLDVLFDFLRRHAVDEVIIALPESTGVEIRGYVLACCQAKVPVRVVPVIAELLGNPSSSRGRLRMQDLSIEDLLHRPSVQLNPRDIGPNLTGKRVLVTGAGGSIGSELCRQISQLEPELLILLGHGENSIFQIKQELARSYPHLAAQTLTVIADIRDRIRLNDVIEEYHPHALYHAAAHKHVPLMEENIVEAVNNNIGGTLNVIRAASSHGVERMVLISTDKAVNPSSIMGATKYLCEELVRAEVERSSTSFITVRFGNVLGSRGSVLPIFQEQLLHGGPITVTHPEMSRYFMTIPEAASLVLEASASGQSGSLFVLDMGKPIRIIHLAEDYIRLSGLEPYRDIDIQFCGLRPGEKLSEQLFSIKEEHDAKPHGRMFVVNRPQYMNANELDHSITALLESAARNAETAVQAQLLRMIPTFRAATEFTSTPSIITNVPHVTG